MKTTHNLDPFYPGQPERCFVVIDGATVGVGSVRRGLQGYSPIYDYTSSIATIGRAAALECARECVDRYNASLGLHRGHAMACLIGSMRGWHVPGADPAKWTEDGLLIRDRATVAA